MPKYIVKPRLRYFGSIIINIIIYITFSTFPLSLYFPIFSVPTVDQRTPVQLAGKKTARASIRGQVNLVNHRKGICSLLFPYKVKHT